MKSIESTTKSEFVHVKLNKNQKDFKNSIYTYYSDDKKLLFRSHELNDESFIFESSAFGTRVRHFRIM